METAAIVLAGAVVTGMNVARTIQEQLECGAQRLKGAAVPSGIRSDDPTLRARVIGIDAVMSVMINNPLDG